MVEERWSDFFWVYHIWTSWSFPNFHYHISIGTFFYLPVTLDSGKPHSGICHPTFMIYLL